MVFWFMADKELIKSLEKKALEIRCDLLDLCAHTFIHIGGDLSLTDMMTAIWQYGLKYDAKNPYWEERDRFVLSKGHAAAVTSFNQVMIGCYEKQDIFNEYATDFGRFGMHSCNLINPYVEVSTGSLGHGLPVATGIACALKAKGSKSRVFTVMGDGEQQEGTIWEAAMFAHQYKLGNLVGFIDRNKLSLDAHTEDEMALEPLDEKWRAFGWNVVKIDGNNMEQIVEAIDNLPAPDSDVPTLILGETVKGKGVPFMEDRVEWHAGMVSTEDCEMAKEGLRKAFVEKWGEL